MTKHQRQLDNMLVGELPNSGHPGTKMSDMDYPDSGSVPCAQAKPRRSSLVRTHEPDTPEHVVIEPEYYMANYEATVTVHKSPPLTRRPVYDFIEIDDETRDFPALGLHRRRASKKNLKVTFSDHIEVDIISLVEDSDDSDHDPSRDSSLELLDSWNDSNTDMNSNRNCGSPEPNKSSMRRSRPVENRQIRKIDGSSDWSPGRPSQLAASFGDSKTPLKSGSSQSQTLLQRRKQIQKPSLVSDVVQQKIVALNNNSSPPTTGKRFSRSVFPDIVSSLRTDKPVVSGVKRMDASATSRSYDRPWLTNSSSTPTYQQNPRLLKQKSTSDQINVRRTTSLPKNFKLPDSLPSSRFGRGAVSSPRTIKS